MCGRFTVLTKEELADVVDSIRRRRAPALLIRESDGGQLFERFQARPGSEVNAITNEAGEAAVRQFIWGFAVPWSAKPVINTRLESALSGSKLWESPLRDGRCILPAATFFETQTSQMPDAPESKRTAKRSYEFSQPDGLPLLIAGVQEAGRVSVVTTQPNATVAPIHPRMPLFLSFQEAPLWLAGKTADLASLADRSAILLAKTPEYPRQSNPDQLSLF